MPRIFSIAAASFALSGCSPDTSVAEEAPRLELTGRVVDAAEILDSGFEKSLTAKLAALETSTRVQLVVATTPDLDSEDILFYSVDLANAWGLGSEERNDGLLLLVAPNERQVRIAVGKGLEETVKDEEAAVIIQESLLPAFRQGDFESGINAGVDQLIHEVAPLHLKEAA